MAQSCIASTCETDVFALNSSELRATDLVQHVINTEDHPPIHQLAQRISFALEDKVERLVNDVLEKVLLCRLKAHGQVRWSLWQNKMEL